MFAKYSEIPDSKGQKAIKVVDHNGRYVKTIIRRLALPPKQSALHDRDFCFVRYNNEVFYVHLNVYGELVISESGYTLLVGYTSVK